MLTGRDLPTCGALPQLLLTSVAALMLFNGPCSAFEPKPFDLAFDPPDVIRGVTHHVRVQCEYGGKIETKLKKISRARLFKKSSTGWDLLADESWYNTPLRSRGDDSRRARHTLLKFGWNSVSDDVFGIYRCDVIGLDKMAATVTESTPEVELPDMDLQTYLVKTKLEHKREKDILFIEINALHKELKSLKSEVTDRFIKDRDDINSIQTSLPVLDGKLDSLDGDMATLKTNVQAQFANRTFEDIKRVPSKVEDKSIKGESPLLYRKVNAVEEILFSLNDSFSTLTEELYSLSDSVDRVKINFSVVDESVKRNAKVLSLVKHVCEANQGDIDALKYDLKQDVTSFHRDIGVVQHAVANIQRDVLSAKKTQDVLGGNVSSQRSEIVLLQRDLGSAKERLTVLNDDYKTVRQNTDDLSQDFIGMQKNVSTIHGDLVTAESHINSLTGSFASEIRKVSSLLTELKSVKDGQASIKRDLSSVGSQVAAARNGFQSLDLKVVDLTSRVTSVEKKVTSIKKGSKQKKRLSQ